MKEIGVNSIKELRARTGAGIMNCKRALLAVNNIEEAIDYLRKKGIAKADEKLGRIAGEGIIETYIHPGSRLGVIIELRCETDFTVRTPEFKQLAKDLAMQVAAINPRWVSREEIPKEEIEHELEIYNTQAKESGKPDKVIEQITQGKLEKFYKEVCLLEQPFIKNSEITINELIKEYIGKLRENIYIKRFTRFRID
ncbi:elongation factor Ts [candidate division WOR-3 bacterium]|nr:elongation factor Ts [candidate division WOR-3 bacterium]